ncbi:alpha/beta hydrolase [Shewanella salipaludis]|uniref:Alpha/beta hydrolase n=1 Tax=Shewanella salipaludis TaxID=2723052 RepID=A0A972G137_9GAMM|nr:alpha/beta hydrolase [Shewanella salipaludis]NMH66898.1 alpha/beta hydrolase [Shewanella salipaludis]
MSQLYLEQGIGQLVQAFIAAGCPSVKTQTIAERRQGYLDSVALAGPQEAVARVEDMTLEGIDLRLYRSGEGNNASVLVYFHGGCFVSGGFETHEQQLRRLANLSGALIVAVKYRLAPEHGYPAAHDDAFKATQLVRRHCRGWGGDPDNIILAGDSAGGHLALVTCLRLRDSSDWLPRKQVLIYPMLDATAASRSYRDNGDHYIITRDTLLSGFDLYLNDLPRMHPEASPLYRQDLAGLPETHILTAEFDPLVDEGELCYRNLLAVGVNAHCRRYLGVIHGFFQLSGVSQAAREAIVQLAGIIAAE